MLHSTLVAIAYPIASALYRFAIAFGTHLASLGRHSLLSSLFHTSSFILQLVLAIVFAHFNKWSYYQFTRSPSFFGSTSHHCCFLLVRSAALLRIGFSPSLTLSYFVLIDRFICIMIGPSNPTNQRLE
jgi:hypothetical protein